MKLYATLIASRRPFKRVKNVLIDRHCNAISLGGRVLPVADFKRTSWANGASGKLLAHPVDSLHHSGG